MKISVIMIDGGFRENTYGAKYFSEQTFDDNEFEVIWVEFYSQVSKDVTQYRKIKIVTLNNQMSANYHSSYCFNKGIALAKGELIVIPDADQIVEPDFLTKLWNIHLTFDKLVVYPYRYDELSKGILASMDFSELERKCVLKNPTNYGGCLSVRRKWLLEINGYEQHEIFESGFHANGLDMYTRFKNFGLAIMWVPEIRMYHPWHPLTLHPAAQYTIQSEFIQWRSHNLQYLALLGINTSMNFEGFNMQTFISNFHRSDIKFKAEQPSLVLKFRKLIKQILISKNLFA